jgi:hypothetical protein
MPKQLLSFILESYRQNLGADFDKYHNHCQRVFAYSVKLCKVNKTQEQQLAIAAAFHDIGIWTADTFDYLDPSVTLAKKYLIENGLESWCTVVAEIIMQHHKLTAFKSNKLAESFRQADLVDLSLGLITFGIAFNDIKALNEQYPTFGFHRFIAGQIVKNVVRHPFNPVPIVKW